MANHVTHNYTAACSPYLLLRRIERARLDGSRSAFTRRLSARVELVVGRAAAVHWLVVDVALLIWSTIHCSIEGTYSIARHLHQMLRVLGSKSRRGDRGIIRKLIEIVPLLLYQNTKNRHGSKVETQNAKDRRQQQHADKKCTKQM